MIERRTVLGLLFSACLAACADVPSTGGPSSTQSGVVSTESSSSSLRQTLPVFSKREAPSYTVEKVDLRVPNGLRSRFAYGGKSYLARFEDRLAAPFLERNSFQGKTVNLVIDVQKAQFSYESESVLAGVFQVVDARTGTAISGRFPFSWGAPGSRLKPSERVDEIPDVSVSPTDTAGSVLGSVVGSAIARGAAASGAWDGPALIVNPTFEISSQIRTKTFGCEFC